MTQEELKEKWLNEERLELIGWDFSYISNRTESEELPWDYKSVVSSYLSDKMYLLDLGTGGGEFLSELKHPHGQTAVTESYPPNLELCRNKLSSLGIDVQYGDHESALPFESESFDTVIDRHESYELSEVYRVLKPGGVFITQQVGETNNLKLARFVLNKPDLVYVTENEFHSELLKANHLGFEIIRSEQAYPVTKYFDVGAFVYLAKIIEWEFVGFSVERHFDKLLQLHNRIECDGCFKTLEHRYLNVLRK